MFQYLASQRGISVGVLAFQHASFYYRDNENAEWAQNQPHSEVEKSVFPQKSAHKNGIKFKAHREMGNLCKKVVNNIHNHIAQ